MKKSIVILCTVLFLLPLSRSTSFALPYHSTAQEARFGNSSIYFDGSGDYLSTPDHDDWYFGSQDFTIDLWANFESVGPQHGLFGQSVNPTYSPYFHFELSVYTDTLVLHASTTDIHNYGMQSDVLDWNPGQWYHIALVREQDEMRIYRDGSLVGSQAGFGHLVDQDAPFSIGNTHYQGSMQGNMEEFRVSNGIARWDENFTPPAEPYGDADLDDYTKLLIRSEASNLSTSFEDSSTGQHSITANGNPFIPPQPPQNPVPEPATMLLLVLAWSALQGSGGS